MIFQESSIEGVYVVELERRGDERGFFARTFCEQELNELGLNLSIKQTNMSFNVSAGTLRGFHFQKPPYSEVKIVRCTRGSIIDVAVDLRESSPTYLHHVSVELTQENRKALIVPTYCAHAFQTLEDNTEINYQVTAPYSQAHEGGLRYNDPSLGIKWPLPVTNISDKDNAWPFIENNIT